MKPILHGRSILYAYAGVAIPALAALLLYPSLIKNLGPERFGALSLALSIALFFSSFDFGVGLAITRYVARLNVRSNSASGIKRLVRHALILQCSIGTLIGLILIGIERLSGFLGPNTNVVFIEEFSRAVVWLSISIPLTLISGIIRSAIEAIGRFGLANTLRAPASIGTLLFPVAMSYLTPKIDIIMLSMLGARALTTAAYILSWKYVSLNSAPKPSSFPSLIKHFRILTGFGGWVMIGNAAGGVMVLGLLDRFLIAKLLGLSLVIKYSVPSDIITRSLLIPSAISSVLITLFSKQFYQDKEKMIKLHRQAINIMAGQAGPITVFLILNVKIILLLLTGNHPGVTEVLIFIGMATGYFIQCIAHVPHCELYASGFPKSASLRSVVQLPFYAGASYFVLINGHIQYVGFVWAAWAMIDIFMLYQLRKLNFAGNSSIYHLLHPSALFWGIFIVASAISALLIEDWSFSLMPTAIALIIFIFNLFRLLFSNVLQGEVEQ